MATTKRPTHLVRITLLAAYDRPQRDELAPGIEALAEGFAEQLRDDGAILTVASEWDEAEQQLDPHDPGDELVEALLEQWPTPPAKLFALYTSVARYGTNDISLYPSQRAAYAALADTLQQIEDDPDAEDIPEDFDELVEWCEARADDDGCEWYVSEVELPKEAA